MYKRGDLVYFGYDNIPSEVLDVLPQNYIVRKPNPWTGEPRTSSGYEQVVPHVMVHHKTIYQRLADLEGRTE